MVPTLIYLKVEGLLTQYLTKMNAVSVLNRALRKHGLYPHTVHKEHLNRIAPELKSGLLLFAQQAQRDSIIAELRRLDGGMDSLPPPRLINVSTEADIAVARGVAKTICESMGAPTLTTHKTATITSELSRNIVLYAGAGEITFEGYRDKGSFVKIVAVDEGPGIESLSLVLSGSYRSKTGMGKGLLGVRRLCDSFDVNTGPRGTRVSVQVKW